jgi:predicted AAA+ superfamily ATPase
MKNLFERSILTTLVDRLAEPRGKIQILSGARQVGKTTLAIQALDRLDQPHLHIIAESGFNDYWIDQQWAIARALSKEHPEGAILVIDEIQKIKNWSERVKRLWDEDTLHSKPLKVLLLGSSSLLLQKGLTESMTGRYEVIHVPHWSFAECSDAFGMSLDEYLYFGGYPGAVIYRHDEDRFLSYLQDSIIEPVVTRDILSQFIVHKPALLRQLFYLGTLYSGQIISYSKLVGQLQDAGNTTTLAHYITLLNQAEVLSGLYKFANAHARQRQSPPKFQVYNTALMTAVHNVSFSAMLNNPELKGRFVESAIGTHLLAEPRAEIFYWREDNHEVDFVVKLKEKLIAIEVKSGQSFTQLSGIDAFAKQFHPTNMLLIGTGGIPLDTFLKRPLSDFL